jgi:hypothetical protein
VRARGSGNARIRWAVKARGHFPNEQAALKCIYMAIVSLDPTGEGHARWTSRWKTALNALDITFDSVTSTTLVTPFVRVWPVVGGDAVSQGSSLTSRDGCQRA